MPPPGTPFGRWTLVQPIAQGGTGTVWRAIEAGTGAAFAVKLLPLDAGGAELAARESEVMVRVRHPGVVRVHATLEAHGHAAIVLDLAEGSLAELVQRAGPLPVEVALDAALLASEALAAAHAAGVVHRDVKPHNLLWFREAPHVRLADFGIARAPADARTRTGALLGSIPFMAPEQRRDARAVLPATDVYALAVTLAWLCLGEAPDDPFAPDAAGGLTARGIDARVAKLITELGSWRPGDRPRDGETLRARLLACRDDLSAGDGAFVRWVSTRAELAFHGERHEDPASRGDGSSESWGGGGAPPSRSALDADLRGRGLSLAALGAASPVGERSLPTLAAQGPYGANRGGVPSATPPPARAHGDGTRDPLPPSPNPRGALGWASLGVTVGAALVGGGVVLAVWLRGGEGRFSGPVPPTMQGASDADAVAATGARTLMDLSPCPDAIRTWVDDVRMGPRESIEATIDDLDADGFPDVLVNNNYSESVSVWWGKAGAMPAERTELATGRSDSRPFVADLDGDGLRDLVVANNDDARFTVLRGRGHRRFEATSPIFQSPAPRRPVAFDADRDGLPDLYFSHNNETTTFATRPGTGALTWDAQRLLVPARIPVALVRPATGDPWMLLQGTDTRTWWRFSPHRTPVVLEALDLPDDTDAVLVARPPGSQGEALHLVGRSGIMRVGEDGTRCRLSTRLPATAPLALGDLDGDGTLDAVRIDTCARCESNHVFVRGLR